MKKQKLLCLYKAFYQCANNTAKVQFLHKHKTVLQNYKINFVNVLALYAGIFVMTFFTLFNKRKDKMENNNKINLAFRNTNNRCICKANKKQLCH